LLRRPGIVLALTLAIGAPSAAWAGPDSEVASAADEGDPFDLHVSIDYVFDARTTVVKRERGGEGDPGEAVPLGRDLVSKQTRHTIIPRLELGLFHDIAATLAMPIVILDARQLDLDRRDTPCDASGNCVDRDTSSTILDGLLPSNGYDADDPATGFPGDGSQIFRGKDRKGLDQIHLGLVWAPMNQLRDDTKPTWKLGAELRLAVGKLKKFDAANPDANTGVSSGVHEVRLYSSMAKRVSWAEPYFEAWWQAPFAEKQGSLFQDPGFGARSVAKQQQAGARFGFEAIAVDRGPDLQRVSLDLSARLVGHFEGRNYSELWEVFALAGDTEAGGPLVLDSDPTDPGMQAMSHPGITNIENYLELGGRLALRADLGPLVHVAAFGEFSRETTHAITFGDAGVDRPTCEGGDSEGDDCENGGNDVVNPGTSEVNPLHAPLIDLVGHRYISDNGLNLALGVEARILF
jgi:hypothetical protein